ncbi:hypothetical protein HFP15_30090 [Amycolatopsis sp. K13G38]|uniref:Uncharacterized protein n=1 Tax=Amycolatopsis acididurans TaxID=2724524 RepID=A0ABX1JE33_9PSEU|nr:hypothetical protein [Amycolatopsis acididurans]NKQ57129.1 hypothetical protein [Amycolatopsis acididurans]
MRVFDLFTRRGRSAVGTSGVEADAGARVWGAVNSVPPGVVSDGDLARAGIGRDEFDRVTREQAARVRAEEQAQWEAERELAGDTDYLDDADFAEEADGDPFLAMESVGEPEIVDAWWQSPSTTAVSERAPAPGSWIARNLPARESTDGTVAAPVLDDRGIEDSLQDGDVDEQVVPPTARQVPAEADAEPSRGGHDTEPGARRPEDRNYAALRARWAAEARDDLEAARTEAQRLLGDPGTDARDLETRLYDRVSRQLDATAPTPGEDPATPERAAYARLRLAQSRYDHHTQRGADVVAVSEDHESGLLSAEEADVAEPGQRHVAREPLSEDIGVGRDTDAVLERIDALLAEPKAAPLGQAVAECGHTVAAAEQALRQAEGAREDQARAERCARWSAADAAQTAAEMSEGREWA